MNWTKEERAYLNRLNICDYLVSELRRDFFECKDPVKKKILRKLGGQVSMIGFKTKINSEFYEQFPDRARDFFVDKERTKRRTFKHNF